MELQIPETIGTKGGLEWQFSLFLLARHFLPTGYVVTGVNRERLQLLVDNLKRYLQIDLPPLPAGRMPKDFGKDALNIFLQINTPTYWFPGPLYKSIYFTHAEYAETFLLEYLATPAANANDLLLRFADFYNKKLL